MQNTKITTAIKEKIIKYNILEFILKISHNAKEILPEKSAKTSGKITVFLRSGFSFAVKKSFRAFKKQVKILLKNIIIKNPVIPKKGTTAKISVILKTESKKE